MPEPPVFRWQLQDQRVPLAVQRQGLPDDAVGQQLVEPGTICLLYTSMLQDCEGHVVNGTIRLLFTSALVHPAFCNTHSWKG